MKVFPKRCSLSWLLFDVRLADDVDDADIRVLDVHDVGLLRSDVSTRRHDVSKHVLHGHSGRQSVKQLSSIRGGARQGLSASSNTSFKRICAIEQKIPIPQIGASLGRLTGVPWVLTDKNVGFDRTVLLLVSLRFFGMKRNQFSLLLKVLPDPKFIIDLNLLNTYSNFSGWKMLLP